jgi:hypothetical protein
MDLILHNYGATAEKRGSKNLCGSVKLFYLFALSAA